MVSAIKSSWCQSQLKRYSTHRIFFPIAARMISNRILKNVFPTKPLPRKNLSTNAPPKKIAVLGGGNWGSAVARRIGFNLHLRPKPQYDSNIRMWVYEEMIGKEKLTEIINTRHENVKYLPGVFFPANVKACPDLLTTCQDANILLFVFPHQFLGSTLKQLKGRIPPSTTCVSLIKGIDVGPKGLRRYTQIIKEELGVENVAAVMGANVANDIALDFFAETTVGAENLDIAKEVASLFQCDTLRTDVTDDISTVELCGALKNVVALGAGICDGMEMGCSTKAAVIRQGLEEMALFCRTFDTTGRYKNETLVKSCGIADTIATSYGGRNRLCSMEFTKRYLWHYEKQLTEDAIVQLWQDIEEDLLHGQKLQGVSTCKEVMNLLLSSGYLRKYPSHFPLFRNIHRIVCYGESYEVLFDWDYY